MNSKQILIMEDEPDIRTFYRDVAEQLGLGVAEASSRASFAAAYGETEPDAIIVDLAMDDIDGVELLRNLAELGCRSSIILASGQEPRVLTSALTLGRELGLDMLEAFSKPVSLSRLESVLLSVCGSAAVVSVPALENALALDQFRLHFQPQFNLQSVGQPEIIGCEALARWNHPHLGFIPPVDFIPVIEANGLIEKFTDQVIEKAIAQLAAWRALGITLPISFNLSPIQLVDLTLPDRIAAMLEDWNISPRLLTAEVTEQAAMADVTKANDILTRLRLKNIDVSLDDFGAGFSSLVKIYRLPLSELKLDRSLIRDVDDNEDARKVVRAMIDLSHSLDVPVCAEGIETNTVAEFLKDAGCDKAQGFLFAKPLSPTNFVQLVTGRMIDTGTEPEQKPWRARNLLAAGDAMSKRVML